MGIHDWRTMSKRLGNCKKCDESFTHCALSALLADCGARLSWDPSECRDGEPHDFEQLDENTAAVIEDEPGAWDNEMEEFDAEM